MTETTSINIAELSMRHKACSACSYDGDYCEAVAFCATCQEFLCSQCCKAHRKMRVTRDHTIIPKNQICPGKPLIANFRPDAVLLIWDLPPLFKDGDHFHVTYKNVSKGLKWKANESEHYTPNVTITGLQPNTTYKFRVKVIYEDGDEGPYSQESEEIRTPPSLALKLTESLSSSQIKGSPSIYSLPFTEMKNAKNSKAYSKRFALGNPPSDGYLESKTILLVGATGTGKSTFVDSILNYILGVTWEDPFRFTVTVTEEKDRRMNQALSQTEFIYWYTIYPEKGSRLNYQLHIIDTPGFGDTRGLQRDQEIFQMIRLLFSENEPRGVTFIDAVCFFLKAPDARLTAVQSYIFQSIMSLFGRDIESNICSIITFADGTTPPVLAALQQSRLPFGKYFMFNNSCIFSQNDNDEERSSLGFFFWNIGVNSFDSFFKHLDHQQSKSLKMSHEVLRERFCLQANFRNLKENLDVGLNIIRFLKQEKGVIQENKTMIETNKYFEYEVEETKQIKIPIPEGGHDLNCTTCSFRCHANCICEENKSATMCKVMNSQGFCEVCPGKCNYIIHVRNSFRYEFVNLKVKKTCEDMQAKYSEAKGLLTHSEMIEKNEQKLIELTEDIKNLIILIQNCSQRLQKIALRPDQTTVQEFIDLLIGEEEMSMKAGYFDNINSLKELRDNIDSQFTDISKEDKSSVSIEETFQQVTLRLRSYIPNYKQ